MLTEQCNATFCRPPQPHEPWRWTEDLLGTQALSATGHHPPLGRHQTRGQVAGRPEQANLCHESSAVHKPSGKAPQLQSRLGALGGPGGSWMPPHLT